MSDINQDPFALRKLPLTVNFLKKLPFAPNGKQITIMDETLKGFGIRISATKKTFIVYKRSAHGDPKRVTICDYGSVPLEEARKLAEDILKKVVGGVDVIAERRAKAAEEKKQETVDTQTLRWVFDRYEQEHLIDHKGKDGKGKEGTIRSMQDTRNFFCQRTITTLKFDERTQLWFEDAKVVLSDWMDRPFRSITANEVLERFNLFAIARPQKLINKELKPMCRTHQIAFKFAQAAYSFIIPKMRFEHPEIKEILENPFEILKVYKRWTNVNVRTRIVDFENIMEFGRWWDAVLQYQKYNAVQADYILFSLIQGGRSIEIYPLTWDDVDFDRNEIIYRDTKNHEDYIFPMSKIAREILERRKRYNIPKNSPFVFAYPQSKTGHVPYDSKQHFHNLHDMFGAKYVSTHDLKRTFASASDNFVGKIAERDIEYLLKHTFAGVNSHYFMKNKRRLTETLQLIEDYFVGLHKDYLAKFPRAHQMQAAA